MPRMICTRRWQAGIHRVKGAAAGSAAGIKLHWRIGRRSGVLAGRGTNNNAAAGALAAGGLPRARNGLSQPRIRRHRATPLVMLLLMLSRLLLLLLLLRGKLMVMMMMVVMKAVLRALRVLGRVALAAGGH
jgi:hypothetical protein